MNTAVATSARSIVAALGGKWFTTYGYVKCLAHNDGNPSLRLRDGENGKLLVFCHAGCTPELILGALRARGVLLGGGLSCDTADEIRARDEEQKKKDANTLRLVKEIWQQARPIGNMASERYLRNRAITIDLPPSLRHHAGLRHPADQKKYHALVGGVQAPDRTITGIQRIFVTPKGEKVSHSDVKLSLGHISGGAVRLAAAGEEMAVGEGIETCLSYMEMKRIPTWAALSTSGLRSVVLPPLPLASIIHIAVDDDENKAGEIAAYAAAERFQKEGREVRFDFPPPGFKDFNDYLVAHAR